MRLAPGSYFGKTLFCRRVKGLTLTLSGYASGQRQPLHVHANPTLFLLLSGHKHDRSRTANHEQAPFVFVYHPTKEPHAGSMGPTGAVGLNLEFDRGWLSENNLCERELGGYRIFDEAWPPSRVLRLLGALFHDDEWARAELESRALECLEPLLRPWTAPKRAEVPGWLRRAKEFVHDSFNLPIGLALVAREVGVHPIYFARVFRRQHGCSLGEYIRGLRLAAAVRLILGSGCSIAQSAQETGFFDQAHLTHHIAKQFGCSPGS